MTGNYAEMEILLSLMHLQPACKVDTNMVYLK